MRVVLRKNPFVAGLLIVAAASSLAAGRAKLDCPTVKLAAVPELGTPVKVVRTSGCLLLTASGAEHPYFIALVHDLAFDVAFDQESKKVVFVGTKESRFATPEGVHPGDPLKSLPDATTKSLVREQGWGAYVCLSSGWCAFFPTFTYKNGSGLVSVPVTADTPITMVFKRGASKRAPNESLQRTPTAAAPHPPTQAAVWVR